MVCIMCIYIYSDLPPIHFIQHIIHEYLPFTSWFTIHIAGTVTVAVSGW